MTTLTDFLLARIAEDEENAGRFVDILPEDTMTPLFRRILAECEAKRRIVEEHGPEEVASLERGSFGKAFVVCRRCQTMAGQVVAPCHTLRHLAAVYADHPDYQTEWATE